MIHYFFTVLEIQRTQVQVEAYNAIQVHVSNEVSKLPRVSGARHGTGWGGCGFQALVQNTTESTSTHSSPAEVTSAQRPSTRRGPPWVGCGKLRQRPVPLFWRQLGCDGESGAAGSGNAGRTQTRSLSVHPGRNRWPGGNVSALWSAVPNSRGFSGDHGRISKGKEKIGV
jgi:hypothetical protein